MNYSTGHMHLNKEILPEEYGLFSIFYEIPLHLSVGGHQSQILAHRCQQEQVEGYNVRVSYMINWGPALKT